MSRKKLFLSIFLMASLVSAGIVLPSMTRAERQDKQISEKQKTAPKTEASTETRPASTTPDFIELQYLDFEYLENFFSHAQTEDLKDQLASYLQETGRTDISSITFLADETTYPTGGETLLSFSLSDGSTLPVACQTATGTFTFGEEKRQLYPEHSLAPRVYIRQTDDSLPAVTTEEIESMQEGGYADTKSDADEPTGGLTDDPNADHTENSDEETENYVIINAEEAQP